MKKSYVGMVAVILSSTVAVAACHQEEEATEHQLDGVSGAAALAPLATFSHSDGLRFASDEAARAWAQEAPGIWRHGDSQQRLIIGEQGHRVAAEQLEAELDALYAGGADDSEIAAKQALLAAHQEAAAHAGSMVTAAASCDIATYNGPSSPFTGYTGGAALAQISCINGTIVFTVETRVCTGSSGCSLVSRQTAVPDSLPRLWGTARSGVGTCSGYVYLTPSGVFDSSSYTCN